MIKTRPLATETTYRDRVTACWLGKAVGGTLGMLLEGEDGPFDLTYYSPVPTQMLPNDDLDLQVVWACVLAGMDTVRVDREVLADAWLKHVGYHFDEYGVAIRNLKQGLRPPCCGSYDNWFIDGMGAAIRSELWACLAPGDPDLAATYAVEDACVDHDGDGIWAEVFLAAMESVAFVESDIDRLLDAGLAPLARSSRLRRAIVDTRRWHATERDWRVVRQLILDHYGHENFTDVVMNLCFIVVGLLEGAGDFDRTVCVAVNCGKDTDCTGATVAALMGIRDPSCIDDKWLEPIGRSLELSSPIRGIDAPKTLDDLTDLVIDVRERLAERRPTPLPSAREVICRPIQMSYACTEGPWFGEGWPTSRTPALPNGLTFEVTSIDGTMGRFSREQVTAPALVVRYAFELKAPQRVCVMFNTPHPCRVWVDDDYVFGRDGGRMAPSFHRVPVNQFVRLELSAGRHTLTAAMLKPVEGDMTWVVGVGDTATSEWLVDVFQSMP